MSRDGSPFFALCGREHRKAGKRIETRLLQKALDTPGYASWWMVSYAWDAAQTEAVIARWTAREDGRPELVLVRPV